MKRDMVGADVRGSTGILPVGPMGFQPVTPSLFSTGETPVGPTGKMPVLQAEGAR